MSANARSSADTAGPPTKQRKIVSFFAKSISTRIQSQPQLTSCDPQDQTAECASSPTDTLLSVSLKGTESNKTSCDQPNRAIDAVLSAKAHACKSKGKDVSPATKAPSPVKITTTGKAQQWYKGCKLDAAWLQKHYLELQTIKLHKRKGLKCKTCYDNIAEAKKFACNGTIPLADGVRCDGTLQLQRIIDHLKGGVHAAAQRADTAQKLWIAQSDRHPWVKILKQHNVQLVSTLIRLAVDVHNDSVTKTLSAWSWPSRSLAQMHADNQIMQYTDHGLECDFVPFNPPQSSLLYRNPDRYSEMLSFVSRHELNKLIEALRAADCIALQIDKSVDKYNVDSIFVTARYMDTASFEMRVGFLGECHSEVRGVAGMVDALHTRFKYLQIDDVIYI